MYGRERRKTTDADHDALRAALTPAQRAALPLLERFGWKLRFVRRPLFQDPVPILFDREGERWVTLEADGSINENPGFKLRD
ncbi:hypothetical protein E4582_09720 [Luteimonas yindakuii]|uniref:Uncharacterized protein n=1 Tax=Luteimonas yindakuii TaxID=2565782 RepID=A0A4Z1R5V7_9GAMM|nr:hypothetical protein [Luteimonas yindakuii]TKS55012.1 hypothetical protein E4582_09720 [Luteimonas yindakuii]